jgi:hypothetical protein
MLEDEINREVRREKRLRSLGTRFPKCAQCDETDPFAVARQKGGLICYECHAMNKGRSPIEKHHLAGRHYDDFTIAVPGNDHRILTAFQLEGSIAILRNPARSRILKAAAYVDGWLDVLRLMEARLRWIPQFLRQLDSYLTKLRPNWQKEMEDLNVDCQ